MESVIFRDLCDRRPPLDSASEPLDSVDPSHRVGALIRHGQPLRDAAHEAQRVAALRRQDAGLFGAPEEGLEGTRRRPGSL